MNSVMLSPGYWHVRENFYEDWIALNKGSPYYSPGPQEDFYRLPPAQQGYFYSVYADYNHMEDIAETFTFLFYMEDNDKNKRTMEVLYEKEKRFVFVFCHYGNDGRYRDGRVRKKARIPVQL
jgi:hypothetical protein